MASRRAALSLAALLVARVVAAAEPLELAEIFSGAGLSGARISGVAFSPDSRHVTYLLPPDAEGPADLWHLELATGEHRVLVAAASLPSDDLGAVEASSLERQRVKHRGITSYRWIEDGSGVLLPHRGDVFVWRPHDDSLREGTLERLTSTKGPELTPAASADGTRVLVSWEHDLWLLEQDRADCSWRETRLTFDGTKSVPNGEAEFVAQEEMGRHEALWLSRDGRAAAFLRADLTDVPAFRVGDALTERGAVTEQAYPKAGDPNAVVRLGLLDLRDLEKPVQATWVPLPAPDGTRENDLYVPFVRALPDGRWLVASQPRDQRRMDVSLLAPSGAIDTVWTAMDDRWVDIHGEVHWLGTGLSGPSPRVTGMACLASHRDQVHVGRVDFDDRRGWQPLTSGAWSVHALHGVDAARGLVYFTADKEAARERHLYRVPLTGGEPERLTWGGGVHSVKLAPDFTWFVDSWSSVTRPPSWTVVSLVAGRAPVVLEANVVPRLAQLAPVEVRFLEVPGADGGPLHARLMLPATLRAGERRPVLVYCYGGPGSQFVMDSWGGERDLFERYLVERGWITFRVDGRGTGGRGLAFVRDLWKDLGRREAADQAAGARWLAQQPFVRPDAIALTGWSYGGYLTLMTLLQHPGVFRAGIAGAPVTDWRDYDTHYTERFMGLPSENAEGYDRSAPLTHAASLEDALLIVHGLTDDNVHFQDSARMVAALVEHGKVFDQAFYPGQKHGLRGAARLHYQALVERFLDREVRNALPKPRPAEAERPRTRS